MTSPVEQKESEKPLSETATELIADYRHNAEEWGALLDDTWLRRLTESEEKLEDYISSLESLLSEQREDARRLDWLSRRKEGGWNIHHADAEYSVHLVYSDERPLRDVIDETMELRGEAIDSARGQE